MTTPLAVLTRDILLYPPCDGSAHKSTVAQHGRHFEVRWGFEQTRFSNMSAGVSIPVSKRSWKPRHVVRTLDAPPKLQGREQAQDASSRATYAETPYCLGGWLRRTLQDTPKRSALYIVMDFDDRMGVPVNDDETQP